MKYINSFLEYLLVIKKHSVHTIVNYKVDLYEFSDFLDKKDMLKIGKEDVNRYLEHLYEINASKGTISRKLSSLRGYYQFLLDNGKVDNNYFKMFKNPKREQGLPKLVKEVDIDKMFLIPDTRTSFGQRNLLIIRMLYATGIRVSELVSIKLKDININDRTIRIFGKGSKERIVVFGNNTMDILNKYLSDGRVNLDTKNCEYLFLNKDGFRLSDRYVRKIIDDIIIKASIDMHVSPHMLRHTFATSMLNNGADLVSVKDLLGHSSLETTSIYTHVSDDKLKEIYNKAHPRA